jgi:uncharacterized membrane protein
LNVLDEVDKKRTYKNLEPGPYCPDTGKAHTTCKALLVAFVAVAVALAFRATRVFSSSEVESAGMTSLSSTEKMALE